VQGAEGRALQVSAGPHLRNHHAAAPMPGGGFFSAWT